MTYSGATAASSLANPPMRIAGGLGGVSEQSTATGGGRGVWLYNSSHQTTGEMMGSNFFTDAYYLGMKQGDLIMGAICTGSSVSVYLAVIGAVTTAGAALASSGGILSSTR